MLLYYIDTIKHPQTVEHPDKRTVAELGTYEFSLEEIGQEHLVFD